MPSRSIYWFFAAALAIWFLFIHSPPILLERHAFSDFPFVAHLLGAYSIYIACIVNTLITPSTYHGKGHRWHVRIGRVGMGFGLISFVFGVYCTWWPYRTNRPPLGFSIGITIGGILQIAAQYIGYTAIKTYQALKVQVNEMEKCNLHGEALDTLKHQMDSALRNHVYCMVSLFVAACGVPAGMRLVDSYVPENLQTLPLTFVILLFATIPSPFADTYFQAKDNQMTEKTNLDTKSREFDQYDAIEVS
jgi:hypothetical protein